MPTLDTVYRSVVSKKIQHYELEIKNVKLQSNPPYNSSLSAKIQNLEICISLLKDVKREAATAARLQELDK